MSPPSAGRELGGGRVSTQINLFNSALLPKRELFSARNVAVGAAGVLGVVVVSAAIAGALSHRQQQQFAASQAQLAATQEKLNLLTQQAAAAKPSPAVQLELDRADALLAMQNTVLALVAPAGGKTTAGFGEHLRGLSRQSMSGLWLDRVVIGNQPGDMRIEGKTLDSALVADYVDRLNTEQAFAGQGFTSLAMTRGMEKPAAPAGTPAPEAKPAPWVDFELSSAPLDDKAANKAEGKS